MYIILGIAYIQRFKCYVNVINYTFLYVDNVYKSVNNVI